MLDVEVDELPKAHVVVAERQLGKQGLVTGLAIEFMLVQRCDIAFRPVGQLGFGSRGIDEGHVHDRTSSQTA
ncbi:hypothetical protein MOP88_14380 [Sphingomonas sp. WKB10]|nr:hypothetical protein [Sphingomonas sp. WKB10]